jgi:hypothetical protein
MKFFNPIRRNNEQAGSAGTGKTTLLSTIRIRDLPSTLEAIWRFGGLNYRPELLRLNLSVANCPFIADDPCVSGMVIYDQNRRPMWRPCSSNSCEAFNVPGVKKLTFSEYEKLRLKWCYTSTEDGQRGIVSLNSPVRYDSSCAFYGLCFDGRESDSDEDDELPTFIFCVRNVTKSFLAEPQFTLSGVEIVDCAKLETSDFEGTGIPSQVTLEGFVELATRALSVNLNQDSGSPARKLHSQWRKWAMQQPTDSAIQAVVELSEARQTHKPVSLQSVILAYMRNPTSRAWIEQLTAEDIDPQSNGWRVGWNENLVSDILNSPCLWDTRSAEDIQEIADGKEPLVLSGAECLAFIRQIPEELAVLANESVAAGLLGDGTRLTVGDSMFVIKNELFDPFNNALVKGKGDWFIETANQLFDVVRKHIDTTKANGVSSGMTRSEDLATGNTVSVLYTNRSEKEDQSINSGSLSGLQSGNIAFSWTEDGSHVTAPVFQTHRLTRRDVAHIWFYKLSDVTVQRSFKDTESLYMCFVDTPSDTKDRMFWVIKTSRDLSSSKLVAVVPASSVITLRARRCPVSFQNSATEPSEVEEIDEDRLIASISKYVTLTKEMNKEDNDEA